MIVEIKMKIKIICISLTSATERREHMTKLLNKVKDNPFIVSWEFFDAYDGKDLTVVNKKIYYNGIFTGWYHDESVFLIDQIEQFARLHYRKFWNIPYTQDISVSIDDDGRAWIYKNGQQQFSIDPSYFRKHMTMNEIGCALSHFEAMVFLNDDDCDALLILEDDVYLVGDLENTLKKVEMYNLLNWDIIFLNVPGYGGNPGYIEPNTMIDYTDEFNLHVYSHFSSTCSYIVKHPIVDKPVINIPLDDYFSRRVDLFMLRVKEPVFMVDYTRLSGESTIVSTTEESTFE